MISRRTILKGVGAVIASGFATAAYGLGIEAPSTRVTTYRLTPPGWPKGYRVTAAVIADLHVIEPFMGLARVRSIVETTNALRPDVILLLGDYAAGRKISRIGTTVPADKWATELARLKAPLGVFAVQGNHDWWDDNRVQQRRAGPTASHVALEKAGIPVLENRANRITHDGGAFWIAGLGDQWAFWVKNRNKYGRGVGYIGQDDLPGTLAQVTDDAPVILMAHEPDIFPSVPARVSLTLSGHTHGGQVALFNWSPMVPSKYGARYIYGHIVEDQRNLIVSAGLGCSFVPLRLGAPPEIVRIELGITA
jgi:uncharacterized protein